MKVITNNYYYQALNPYSFSLLYMRTLFSKNVSQPKKIKLGWNNVHNPYKPTGHCNSTGVPCVTCTKERPSSLESPSIEGLFYKSKVYSILLMET